MYTQEHLMLFYQHGNQADLERQSVVRRTGKKIPFSFVFLPLDDVEGFLGSLPFEQRWKMGIGIVYDPLCCFCLCYGKGKPGTPTSYFSTAGPKLLAGSGGKTA